MGLRPTSRVVYFRAGANYLAGSRLALSVGRLLSLTLQCNLSAEDGQTQTGFPLQGTIKYLTFEKRLGLHKRCQPMDISLNIYITREEFHSIKLFYPLRGCKCSELEDAKVHPRPLIFSDRNLMPNALMQWTILLLQAS